MQIVNEDYEFTGTLLNEDEIKEKGRLTHKEEVKEKVKRKAFEKLKQVQTSHSKICNIRYEELKMQPYLRSHMLNNHEVSLLFALRSRTVRNVKRNFPGQYGQDMMCQLGCGSDETQEHLLKCDKLSENKIRTKHAVYEHLFGDHGEQVAITRVFDSLLGERERLLQATPSLPVAQTGPDIMLPL